MSYKLSKLPTRTETHIRQYMSIMEITGQRLVGVQERIPARPSVGSQEPVPSTSHWMSANLGTAGPQQTNTMDTSVYDHQQRTSRNYTSAPVSIVYPPAQGHPQIN
jgi:hypothetical protein